MLTGEHTANSNLRFHSRATVTKYRCSPSRSACYCQCFSYVFRVKARMEERGDASMSSMPFLIRQPALIVVHIGLAASSSFCSTSRTRSVLLVFKPRCVSNYPNCEPRPQVLIRLVLGHAALKSHKQASHAHPSARLDRNPPTTTEDHHVLPSPSELLFFKPRSWATRTGGAGEPAHGMEVHPVHRYAKPAQGPSYVPNV